MGPGNGQAVAELATQALTCGHLRGRIGPGNSNGGLPCARWDPCTACGTLALRPASLRQQRGLSRANHPAAAHEDGLRVLSECPTVG
jgi:hypothetical protein